MDDKKQGPNDIPVIAGDSYTDDVDDTDGQVSTASLSNTTMSIQERPDAIMSPVTESATILSYIDKTSIKVQNTVKAPTDCLESLEAGLKNYLQERAEFRKKRQQSYDVMGNVDIKEGRPDTVQEKNESQNFSKTSGYCTKFSSFPPKGSASLTSQQNEAIPNNVTMNVKNMPPISSKKSIPASALEFNIPQITKSESPMRSTTSAGDNVKAESLVGSSFQETNTSAAARKPEGVQKGTSISNSQEIFQINEDGKSVCGICQKVFSKPAHLRSHVNIHYFERPFRCDACAISYRTKGHLQKHKRSVSHFNKVNIKATVGPPSTDNPRPFKCVDCMIAFRIHAHLAKHLRSKMHIMKLECTGKLPIGMYDEMERLGTYLNQIDTTDCENSLESLQQMAVKLYEKDPSKLTDTGEMLNTVSSNHLHPSQSPSPSTGSSHWASPHDFDDRTAYSCQLCGLNFPNRVSLQQHLVTHAAPRPYVCSQCDAGFSTQYQLEAHIKLHK